MDNVLRFDEDELRRLAGSRSFERGLAYVASVSAMEIGERSITGTVDGTDAYEVEQTERANGPTAASGSPSPTSSRTTAPPRPWPPTSA
ncbi:hypothetical protein [Streptomyces sp. NPDC089795]|uniref:hypothetical protein n=1 Tax=Streptomyces sp. NPDC089795 TaxID=3155297 RepID=UPI00342E2BB9